MPALEVRTEPERVTNLTTGEVMDALRVKYRKPGKRRWTKFLVVPDEGQTIDDLKNLSSRIAHAHAHGHLDAEDARAAIALLEVEV